MLQDQVSPSSESTLQTPDSEHPQQIWSQISIDLMGTLMEIEGYRYILTMIDYFTKLFAVIPLMTKSGEIVKLCSYYYHNHLIHQVNQCTGGAP